MQKASNQSHALYRPKNQMSKKKKEMPINKSVYSNFNYCSLVWRFCPRKLMRKFEKIQERCLPIILHDYENICDVLLHKSSKST